MYGSIFSFKPKQGKKEDLINYLKKDQTIPEGGVAWFVMNPDEKEHWIGVGVFESKEAYEANANRPEQHEWYLKMVEHLSSEPKWTDGSFVISQQI